MYDIGSHKHNTTISCYCLCTSLIRYFTIQLQLHSRCVLLLVFEINGDSLIANVSTRCSSHPQGRSVMYMRCVLCTCIICYVYYVHMYVVPAFQYFTLKTSEKLGNSMHQLAWGSG